MLNIKLNKIIYFFSHVQQLQVLMDDSRRLQKELPGGNAEQIAQQEAIVLENWGILQERAQQRKKDLLDAQDHYRFMASVSF